MSDSEFIMKEDGPTESEKIDISPPKGETPVLDMMALMDQAMEKSLEKVAGHLDKCLDTILEDKVTAVLTKLANDRYPSSHNDSTTAESVAGKNPAHNVPLGGAGTSCVDNLNNTADAVKIVHKRGGDECFDAETVSLSASQCFQEMFSSPPPPSTKGGS